ncbi:DUF6779 domain-containing protein [Tomitella biformata]|uniref:DUF6779 domain-containing protein n=1 Tax=Tomitella biformata TaxID=630403 RepID=UPI0004679E11|nr:DUF6779 domain-containing protein [Tomitella biformata]
MTDSGRATSPRPNRRETARREPGRKTVRSQSKLQLLLGALIFLAVAASIVMVFTDSVTMLRIGLVAALWAAVIGSIAMTKYRKDSENDAAKTRDLKLVYELQLEREISARREYELVVETQVRRQVEEQVRVESTEELIGLREEISALRSSLEALFDGELPDERTAVRAESHRLQELAGAPGRLVAAQAADLPPIEDVALAQDEDAEGFEPDYEGYRQAAQTVIPGIADADDDPQTAETQILSAEEIAAQGYGVQGSTVSDAAAVEYDAEDYSTDGQALEVDEVEVGEVEDHDVEEHADGDYAADDDADDDDADDEDEAGEVEVELDDAEEDLADDSEHSVRAGGRSVADLMARLQANGTLPESGGRRRRRSED